jgi:uncharacterized BrkB/YihY/UPF0761 family membrane protein
VASFAGNGALGRSTLGRVIGFGAALGTGFLAAAVALVVIYRFFPPVRLRWGAIFRAIATAAAGLSIVSALFVVFINVGTDFQEHYATSGLAGMVLLALWLFLANMLVLVGYKIALETN